MDLDNFYKHINMCLNAVNRLQEDHLPAYQSIKRHSDFEEYFFPYHYHPSYYVNSDTYNYIVQSL